MELDLTVFEFAEITVDRSMWMAANEILPRVLTTNRIALYVFVVSIYLYTRDLKDVYII